MKMKKQILNINTKIYAEHLDENTLKQFDEAMKIECNIQGALMPDAHSGYTLPIGAVVKSKGMIFPSYVGYDIGCGMCAVKLNITKDEIDLKYLKKQIIESIPLGTNRHLIAQEYSLDIATDFTKNIFEKVGKYQIGTLGGGNHFIELGVGKDKKGWIVVHSGSRGFGKIVAEHYMKLACAESIDSKSFVNDYEEKNKEFRKHNPLKFEEAKNRYAQKRVQESLKKGLEGHYGFSLSSDLAKDYIQDMNCALNFALANRKAMIDKIVTYLGSPRELMFINRNHNHAEIENEFVTHRKGATHAKKNMLGVIPANMKDGSFIVKGKGCKDSLESSSHGAGRVLSRKQAILQLDMDEFNKSMETIETNHNETMLDESPKAYKNIFEVMELQKDLVEIIDYVKPILNIKG